MDLDTEAKTWPQTKLPFHIKSTLRSKNSIVYMQYKRRLRQINAEVNSLKRERRSVLSQDPAEAPSGSNGNQPQVSVWAAHLNNEVKTMEDDGSPIELFRSPNYVNSSSSGPATDSDSDSSIRQLPTNILPTFKKYKKNKEQCDTLNELVKLTKLIYEKLPIVALPDLLNSYLSYQQIMEYLDYLQYRYSDFVRVETIGYSFEKRPIKVVKVHWNSRGNLYAVHCMRVHTNHRAINNNLRKWEKSRNIICVEAGTHAREWISVSVALYFLQQLIEKFISNLDLLQKAQFHIIPLLNPDGYEYSKTMNPRWRRNRRPHPNDEFIGADCNRNFNFHWSPLLMNPKRSTYQGECPFSEPESCALGRYLHDNAPKILWYLSLHAHAQCLMYPWAHSRIYPKDMAILKELAVAGRKSIKEFSGRHYRVGSVSQIAKRQIGGSIADYVYGVIKAPLVLVMELPSNNLGFYPSPNFISPICQETWIGMQDMCKCAHKLRVAHEKEWKITRVPDIGVGFNDWANDIDYIHMKLANLDNFTLNDIHIEYTHDTSV